MSNIKRFLLMLLATFTMYGLSLKYGFSQDDFYFLSISHAKNIGEVFAFFSPFAQSGFAFYRPLGTQLYYYLSVLLFGLSRAPLAMHGFMVLIQAANAYLVLRLVEKLTKNSRLTVLVGLLYATSAVHFLSLFYIAATQELLAACFSLLSLNYFLDKKFWRSALFFGIGLLAKETAIVTPVVAFLLTQYENGFRIVNKKYLPRFYPYLLASLFYLLLRLSAGIHVQSDYHMIFGTNVIGGLRWYWWFPFGLPELVTSYAAPHLAVNFRQFFSDFGIEAGVVTVWSLVISSIVMIWTALLVIRGDEVARRQSAVLFLWWLVGIAPVVAIPAHYYPHYLDVGLVPLLILLLSPLKGWRQLAIATGMVVVSAVAVQLSIKTHWTIKRADMAVRAEQMIQVTHACSESSWDIVGTDTSPLEVSYALSGENGPRVLCNNATLQVEYGNMPRAGEFTLSARGILE